MDTMCSLCERGLKIIFVLKHESQAALKIRYECPSANCNGYKSKIFIVDEKRHENYLQNEFKGLESK